MSEPRRGGAWVPVGLWLLVLLTLTSVPSSALPSLSVSVYDSGHLVLYGVLGALVARAAMRGGVAPGRLMLAWPVLAAFGVLDEWHQRFIPGRFPSLTDMAFDAIGAAAGLWLGAYLLRTRWAVWLR